MRNSKIVRRDHVISLTKQEYKQLLNGFEDGIYQLDPCGNPDETQFSYCRGCYQVEYNPHKDDCSMKAFLELIKTNTVVSKEK